MPKSRVGAYHRVTPGTTVNQALFDAYSELYFEAGVYSPATTQIIVPDGSTIIGDGIANTIINTSFKFGSDNTIGLGDRYGLTLGKGLTTGKAFRLKDGCQDTLFNSVRFRSYGTSMLWDLSDYAQWGDAVTQSPDRHCNARDVTYLGCEFEFTNTTGTQFEIWWDVRDGGGSISGFSWYNCVFGARNKLGYWSGGGTSTKAYFHLLCQPSPSEGSPLGPRPYVDGEHVLNHSFDWNQCTHGAGLGSEHVDPNPFVLSGNYFVGTNGLHAVDICCNTRSYYYTTAMTGELYDYDDPSYMSANLNCTLTERANMADQYGTNRGWQVDETNWFGDGYVEEIGPRDNSEYIAGGVRKQSGGTNYSVPDNKGNSYNVPLTTLAHDRALYGLESPSSTFTGAIGQIPR